MYDTSNTRTNGRYASVYRFTHWYCNSWIIRVQKWARLLVRRRLQPAALLEPWYARKNMYVLKTPHPTPDLAFMAVCCSNSLGIPSMTIKLTAMTKISYWKPALIGGQQTNFGWRKSPVPEIHTQPGGTWKHTRENVRRFIYGETQVDKTNFFLQNICLHGISLNKTCWKWKKTIQYFRVCNARDFVSVHKIMWPLETNTSSFVSGVGEVNSKTKAFCDFRPYIKAGLNY